MKKNKSFKNILYVFVLIIIASLSYWIYAKSLPGELDTFAQCLDEKGVKFYGAFWCPHCQAQKALFGNSKAKLPYVECSTPDAKNQTQICKDKQIQNYPTWEFPLASSTASSSVELITGEKTLQELSDKSGCILPEGKQESKELIKE